MSTTINYVQRDVYRLRPKYRLGVNHILPLFFFNSTDRRSYPITDDQSNIKQTDT